MAWPQLSEIQTRLRDILVEPVAVKWTDAELKRFINDAERDIAIKTGGHEGVATTLTTTSGSRLVPFAGHKVNALEYIPGSGNRMGLQRITPKMLGHLPINGVTPQYYFVWGDNIVLEPKPAATYTLYAYISQWPDYEMSDTTDEPLIPVDFHPLLINFALSRAYLKTKKFGTAGGHYQQFVSEAQMLTDIHRMRRKDYNVDLKIPDIVEVKES